MTGVAEQRDPSLRPRIQSWPAEQAPFVQRFHVADQLNDIVMPAREVLRALLGRTLLRPRFQQPVRTIDLARKGHQHSILPADRIRRDMCGRTDPGRHHGLTLVRRETFDRHETAPMERHCR